MRKLRLIWYFIINTKKNTQRELYKLMEFHECGLAKHLSMYTKKEFNEVQKAIDDIKEKYGYNRDSIAAEEDYRVKRDAYKKLR